MEATKAYKAEQVAKAEKQVAEARQALASAEAQLEAWQQAIPYEVQNIMAEAARREEACQVQDEENAKLEGQHSVALQEAYAKGKALLPPEFASKSNLFGIAGAFLFAALVALVLRAVFHVQSEVWLLISTGVGSVLGLFAGFAVFDANFVVDQSLERSVFSRFSAHDTVRRTYFRNSRGQ